MHKKTLKNNSHVSTENHVYILTVAHTCIGAHVYELMHSLMHMHKCTQNTHTCIRNLKRHILENIQTSTYIQNSCTYILIHIKHTQMHKQTDRHMQRARAYAVRLYTRRQIDTHSQTSKRRPKPDFHHSNSLHAP